MKTLILLIFFLFPSIVQAQVIDVTAAGLRSDLSGAWLDGVNSGTSFSSSTYGFTAADVGKIVSVITPGAGGATYVSNIATVNSPTSVTLVTALGINASGLMFYTGTDNTAALNTLLIAGADLYFPRGNYLFAGIVRITKNSIKIHGQGPNTSNLFYVNGGFFPFIDIQSAQFTSIEDLTLWSIGNDWQGWHVTVHDGGPAGSPAQTHIERVGFAMAPWSNGLLLDASLETVVDNSRFSGGFTGIQGASPGSYSNIVSITNTQFAGQGNVPIRSGGEAWTLQSDTFEARLDGRGAAFQGISAAPSYNLNIIGCWFGDVTSPGRNWVVAYGKGFTFTGNTISGLTTDSAIVLGGMMGFTINSNLFADFAYAVNYTGPARAGSVFSNATRATVLEGGLGNADATVQRWSNSAF